MGEPVLEKVTAFITRGSGTACEMLVYRHETAGIQIPAGTVEIGEDHRDAVLREAREETGVQGLEVVAYIGSWSESMPEGMRVILETTPVQHGPGGFVDHHTAFRNGTILHLLEERDGFSKVRLDSREGDGDDVVFSVMGWIPSRQLVAEQTRHFYHLVCHEETADAWELVDEGHHLKPFWARLDAMPELWDRMGGWLAFATETKGYVFA